jgi:hypothetical protein
MKRYRTVPAMFTVAVAWLLGLALMVAAHEHDLQSSEKYGNPGPIRTADASHTCSSPADPQICGRNSGLVPFHKDAIHASLIWTKKSQCPKMLIWMRPSEHKPSAHLNPTVGGVFSGFNETYIETVQGGFGLGMLDESGWSRYSPDIERENAQLIDVCGLQNLIDAEKFTKTSIAELTDADMALSEPFFKNAGFSRGLAYNLFCAGNVAGVDGRIYVIGGHDKGGNNGIRKISIFDPSTERWVKRSVPCVRAEWEEDSTGTAFEHCDALNEDNTDPDDPSDMKYQRWYPTGVTLPDGRILILSGTDQDTSVGPRQASSTKVRQPVPEVYDPRTDTTIALENARKLFNMYPRSFVTQTGPGKDDWKVCVAGGAVVPPLPGEPGGPDITGYDPFFYNGDTYCLDVLAALADPHRNEPAAHHWQLVDTALDAHDSGAAVRMVTINADGTWSQKVFLFGGNSGEDSDNVATAEMIDFSNEDPKWERIDDLAMPAGQNNVVALPDGKLLVVGGRASGINSLHYQLYDPANGTRQALIESPVPRHDHSTALLQPNGGVWITGGNRVQLIGETQPERDLAVPVLEFYQPPYFFKGPRPVIEKAPGQIHYGQQFKLDVSDAGGEIASVALLRTGPITHNWARGNQYVKLPFTKEKNGKLSVTSPPLPGLAIAGDYLLFVVNEQGIPSVGKHIWLNLS